MEEFQTTDENNRVQLQRTFYYFFNPLMPGGNKTFTRT